MLWNTLPDIIKSARNDRQFKTALKIRQDPHPAFKYISIVNRKTVYVFKHR